VGQRRLLDEQLKTAKLKEKKPVPPRDFLNRIPLGSHSDHLLDKGLNVARAQEAMLGRKGFVSL